MTLGKRKLRIGVFAGGVSSEREVSLKSAAQVIKNLSPDKYDIRLIEVSETGRWLLHGTPTTLIEQTSEAPKTSPIPFEGQQDLDLAFIAMHGTFAEDGRLQSLFEILNITYSGSGVLASAIGMNKSKTCELVGRRGIVSPQMFELYKAPTDLDALDIQIQESIHYPCVIKPNASGSSVGVSLVDNKQMLADALSLAFAEGGSVLVEQYVHGREVTCGVFGNSHQTELTAMPVVEVITKSRFFDYNAKYESAETQEICPANLSPEVTAQIQRAAQTAHETLGCDGLTRSDFILSDDGTLYFLEINTIPGMTEASLCPKEAAAMGMSFSQLLDIQIDLALKRHN